MAAYRLLFAGGAVCASLVVHGLGFGLSHRPDVVLIEGGAPASVAILGNSFADMVEGTQHPTDPAKELQEPITPPPTEQPQLQTEPQAAVQPAVQSAPIAPLTAPTPAPAQSAAVAAPPAVLAPVEDPAPKPRPKPAAKPVRKPVQEAKPNPKPIRKGNSTTSEKRGQSDGAATAKSSASGDASGRSTKAGNAAVANYPGKVWRKLQRTRKRGRGRGKAVVGFKIAASGGVASAWIIRSSGNAQLDAAAVKHVHRAAPFPKPPQGAKRQYSYDYVGK